MPPSTQRTHARTYTYIIGMFDLSLTSHAYQFLACVTPTRGLWMGAGVLSMCLGVLYGSFVAIICGEQIAERHQGVLQLQELTKVG